MMTGIVVCEKFGGDIFAKIELQPNKFCIEFELQKENCYCEMGPSC